MQVRHHRLAPAAPGTTRELVSLHHGPTDRGRKAYLQASLHADEVPPMLVAQHLRLALRQLEAEGRLTGEVVLVPAANPIGLAQHPLSQPQGRFDLGSGENFNRHYADLSGTVAQALLGRLGNDAAANLQQARAALAEACAGLPATDELASLRKTLLGLAADADLVLDLHCDHEAVLHLYTTPEGWPTFAPLAQRLGAPLALLASDSGDAPFDEACSTFWPRLAERLGMDADQLPGRCLAATVELRGEVDVCHRLAAQDAQALVDFLAMQGFVDGPAPTESKHAPPLALPLAGSMPVRAPHAGVLVFLADCGERLAAGQPLAELIDPASGACTTLSSPVDGLLYARASRRFVRAGATLAKVAGREPLREGRLMSA
ncbi:MAG TPA: succinylglutamate desuccinylase/aspartoacylase family protein [Ideonella sp.]|uniref:succinylglutamate desuccinylase/aspartoacylase family protein n=1 Tax=Ideonella sp. TaxID=1929293 RepID=UPI002E2F4091|nr:succinylglutamate desuccinylase/aspartoacylase family protein [Ideonella sp.]HEX5683742.1 succinylglutamate desuccinylase/aspartoacylase family protein [Ideonella sp.]